MQHSAQKRPYHRFWHISQKICHRCDHRCTLKII